MTDPLERARADLRAGRPWKARDRLTGMLVQRLDEALVDLLAEVHYEMRDLPAAGALWHVTGRRDARAREAIGAWRERYGTEEARWWSLPRPLRETHEQARVRELEAEAKREAQARARGVRTPADGGWRAGAVGCLLVGLVLAFLALTVVGFVTVVMWVWP